LRQCPALARKLCSGSFARALTVPDTSRCGVDRRHGDSRLVSVPAR